MLTQEKFEAEVRAMFNDICIVHDHEMARVVGIHIDAEDYYYIVRTKEGEGNGKELAEGGREYYASAVGACTTLRNLDGYERIENIFTLNGCPPADEFIVSIDARPYEEIIAEMKAAIEKENSSKERNMPKFSFIIWLESHPGHDVADEAHDNGLTDCSWTTCRGTMYLQFMREGNSFEEVALETFKEVASHKGLAPESIQRLMDGTDIDTQSGFYPGSKEIFPNKV